MPVAAEGEAQKHGHGGKRPGSGRKPKGHVAKSALAALDLAAAYASDPPDEIDAVAQTEARASIGAMVKQLAHGASEAGKIAAAVVILDRGYGKPAVEIGGDAAVLPFMMAPTAGQTITTIADIRTEARKHALLAIDVLKRIRDTGQSETARISAGKALLDRGLGTVGKARMPDEQRDRPLGKKEEASRAAELAGTGRYATPSAPRPINGTVR